MKRILALLCCAFVGLATAQTPKPVAPKPAEVGASFEFTRIQVNAFVNLVLNDATTASYSIDPEVLADTREISVRTRGKTLTDHRSMLSAVLEPLGYSVTDKAGMVHVGRTSPAKLDAEVERELVIYRPRYRSAQYLLDLTTSVIADARPATKRVVANPSGQTPSIEAPAGSALAAIDRASDVVALLLTSKQRGVFERAMVLLDVPTPEVMVQATLYEVTVSTQEASALSLAAKLFSGKLDITLAGTQLDNSVRLSLPGLGIDAFLAALQSDSRFKVVSNPRLRVKDGASARLVVGSEVPTLGALSYPGNGANPVRSVEYRTAGVVFDLSPQIRGDVVDIKLLQQLSSFAKTTTGVNDSPTLIKRDLSSSITAKPGELIVLGGLVDSKTDGGSSGLPFLPAFTHSKSSSDTRTELMLVMSVSSI